MPETERFINDGYGWECRRCRAGDDGGAAGDRAGAGDDGLPRFFREGEAGESARRLSARALARWTDESRRALRCPLCGAEERISPTTGL